MQKILLFGATGQAGRAIARELRQRGYYVTAVVRNEQKAKVVLPGIEKFIIAEATKPETLRGICTGYDVVVSALGKSVSPNDWSQSTFESVDLQGNMNILTEAKASAVRQFVYLSAFGAENLRHLSYFRAHDDFSKTLQLSGLDYAIVQAPAIMSAFLDLAKMARRGWLMTIGDGGARTNPIHEQDLAKVIVNAIGQPSQVLAAGGKLIYTRQEINVLIQKLTAPNKTVRRIPRWLLLTAMACWKVINRNMYDKLAFFAEVIEHDTLAPQIGTSSLEDYFTIDPSGRGTKSLIVCSTLLN